MANSAANSEFDMMHDDTDVLHAESVPLCMALNSAGTRFAVGGDNGYRVFALRPTEQHSVSLVEHFRFPSSVKASSSQRSDSDDGFQLATPPPLVSPATRCGIGCIALLGETDTVAVVGGGNHPIAALNVVVFMVRGTVVNEISVPNAIRRLVMTTQFVVALTIGSLEIVSLTGNRLFSSSALGNALELPPAPLTVHLSQRLIAFPSAATASSSASSGASISPITSGVSGKNAFGLCILIFPDERIMSPACASDDFSVHTVIPEAHHHPLTSVCLNFDGTLVATSSERGTLIRVWKTKDGIMLKELRSSSTASPLSQLCFIGNLYLAGQSANKIKVFFVGEENSTVSAQTREIQFWENHQELSALAKNQTSNLASLGYFLSYFASKWAVAECDLRLLQFTPYCLSLKASPASGSDANQNGTAVAPVATSSSSWLGYLGSWVPYVGGSNVLNITAQVPTPPSSASEPLSFYRPRSLEELCIVWWDQVISRRLIHSLVSDRENGSAALSRPPTSSVSVSSLSSPESEHICYFFCANCDGKLIRFQFDAIKGTISAS